MVKVDGTDPKGFGCKGTPLWLLSLDTAVGFDTVKENAGAIFLRATNLEKATNNGKKPLNVLPAFITNQI